MKINVCILGLVFLNITGCSEAQLRERPIKEPESRTFVDGYENVWRALQLSLRKYPVHINNIDSRILETEYSNGDKLFSDPAEIQPRPGSRSKLTVRVVKGKLEGKSAVKVTVVKSAEYQPDFFAGFQPLP